MEAKSPDLGNSTPAQLIGLDQSIEPVKIKNPKAYKRNDIGLSKGDDRGRYFVYRSGPAVMTTMTTMRYELNPYPTYEVKPGGQRTVQSVESGYVKADLILPVSASPDPQRVGSPNENAKPPVWMSLGDSLTNGTQGACVRWDYQLQTYPQLLANACDVPFNQALIDGPGLPPRIWGTDGNLHLEEADYPSTRGRLPAQGYVWDGETRYPIQYPIHNLAINGFNLRELINLGRCTNQAYFVSDFRFEVEGGMAGTKFNTPAGNSYPVAEQVLQNTKWASGRNKSQISQVKKASPDFIILWAGSNDALGTVEGGLTTQAMLTPLGSNDTDKFNLDTHIQDLDRYQSVRKFDEDIPRKYDNQTMLEALRQIAGVQDLNVREHNHLNFNPTFDDIINDVKEIRAVDEKGNEIIKKPEILLANIPNVDLVAMLFTIRENKEEGVSVASCMKTPADNFPYKIYFFGRDITDDIRGLKLGLKQLDNNDNLAKNLDTGEQLVFDPGSRVSLLAIMKRFGRRAHDAIKANVSIFRGARWTSSLSSNDWVKKDISKWLSDGNTWSKVRDAIFFEEQIDPVTGEKKKVDRIMYFRDDELLKPSELDTIRNRVDGYNQKIRSLAIDISQNPNAASILDNRIFLFKANELLDRVDKQGYQIPGSTEVITTTLNGGVFSFDGVHPGYIGHSVLAYEMMKTMTEIARNRPDKMFGGKKEDDLNKVIRTLETTPEMKWHYDQDEVIRRLRSGQ